MTTLAGLAAGFSQPYGVAVDASGNIYVSDQPRHTIRKVSPAGVVTTIGGLANRYGSAGGLGSAARFNYPEGVAVDASGNVYVADAGNSRIAQGVPVFQPSIEVHQPSGVALTSGSSSVSFGTVANGGSGTPLVFTIKNVGSLDLTGLALSIDGANASDYVASALSVTTLAAGSSTTFSITFTPTGLGSRTAGLHIASNDPTQNPFNIALNGTGASSDADGDGLLDSWEISYWGTTAGHGPADDFDHDGIPELIEEAFGLNPKVPDTVGLPRPVIEGGYLTITITKHPGVTCLVVTADDFQPSSWSAATTNVLIDNATTLKVQDAFSASTASTRVMRVVVTATP